ncbi:MAG: hypothetical protein RJQ09_02110 [Cyclobacteriaceae bacterium]
MFPYIQILPIPTDAQPNALMVASLYLILYSDSRVNKFVFILLSLVIISFLIGFSYAGRIDFPSFRSLFNYLSLLIITCVGILYFKNNSRFSFVLFKIAFFANFTVSLIQKLFDKHALIFFVHRTQTTLSRGVTGLTPEATFNATIALLLLILYLIHFRRHNSKLYFSLFAVWILLLAQSATIVFVFSAALFIFLIVKKFRYALAAIIVAMLVTAAINWYTYHGSQNTRIAQVFSTLIRNPEVFLTFDRSINDRVSHVIAPIFITANNFFRPLGPDYDYFNKQSYELRFKYVPFLFITQNGIPKWSAILSGWGMLFFECGIMGIVFFVVFNILAIKNLFVSDSHFFAFLLFSLLIFTAVSLNTALIPFLFGNFFYLIIYHKKGSKK